MLLREIIIRPSNIDVRMEFYWTQEKKQGAKMLNLLQQMKKQV
jgi:hypothetical protein